MAARYVATYRLEASPRISKLLSCAAAVTGIMGVIAGLLLLFVRDSIGNGGEAPTAVGSGTVYVAICLPIVALTLLQSGALAGFQAFRASAIAALFAAPLFVALPLIGATLNGPSAAIAGLAIAFLAGVLNQLALRHLCPRVLTKFTLSDFKWFASLFATFAAPAALTGVTAAGSIWLGNLWLLGQNNGAQELGWVTVGQLLRALVVFVPAQIGLVSMAALSRAGRPTAGNGEYAHLLGVGLALTLVVAFACAVPLVFALPSILTWFGPDFVGGLSLAKVMLFAAVIESIAISAYQALPSRAFMWHSLTLVAIPRDLAFVVLAAIWIPSSQGGGFANALLVSQVIGLAGTVGARMLVAKRIQPH
jgi:O-antigen/teichoic acid export membrane protein